MDGRHDGLEQRFKCDAALVEGRGAQVVLPVAEEIEEDEGGGRLLREQFDARCGGMDAELKGVEVEFSVVGNDEFAVEDALFRKLIANRAEHLGEVAVEGLFVAALEQNFVAIAKDEDAEAIPFGLIDPVAFRRDGVDALGEHGKNGRVDGELHFWRNAITTDVDATR